LKVLFFSPNRIILPHSIPEIVAFRSLLQQGISVSILGCKGVLQRRCTSQDARNIYDGGLTIQKSELCRECIKAQKQVKEIPGVASDLDIEDLITEEEWHEANKLIEANVQDLISLEISGVPVGRLALYETVLTFKLISNNLTGESERYYRDLLFGSILLCFASKTLVKTESYDFLMLHNSLYCHNQTLSQNLRLSGTQTISFHCGLNFAHRENRLIVANDNFKKFIASLKFEFTKISDHQIQEEIFNKILEHIKVSSGGGTVFAYSSPMQNESVLKKLGIQKNSQVVLAVLSSADELIAAKEAGYLPYEDFNELFVDQFSWIKWLFSWAKKNADREVVIRIHPREAPNRREKNISQSMSSFEKILQTKPKNVYINWPEDNISMYDFVPHVECVLTSWSSAGKEFSLLGIPVISYINQNRSYPDDIHAVANTLEEYNYFLSKEYIKYSFDRSKQIIRSLQWLKFEQFTCSLDLSFIDALKLPSRSLLSRALVKLEYLTKRLFGFEIRNYPHDLIHKAIKQKIPENILKSFKLILKDHQNNIYIPPEEGDKSGKFLSYEECVKRIDKFILSNFSNKKIK